LVSPPKLFCVGGVLNERANKTNSPLGRKNTIFKFVNEKVFLAPKPTVFNKMRMLLTEGNAEGKDFTFATGRSAVGGLQSAVIK
jgi:hypothetical protein